MPYANNAIFVEPEGNDVATLQPFCIKQLVTVRGDHTVRACVVMPSHQNVKPHVSIKWQGQLATDQEKTLMAVLPTPPSKEGVGAPHQCARIIPKSKWRSHWPDKDSGMSDTLAGSSSARPMQRFTLIQRGERCDVTSDVILNWSARRNIRQQRRQR